MIRGGIWDPVLMTIESFDGEEKYVSCIPNPPLYSNEKVGKFMEEVFFKQTISEDFAVYTFVYGDDSKACVSIEIQLPSFHEEESRTLADRLENYVNREIDIIKDGY